jgi:hypothetical protein
MRWALLLIALTAWGCEETIFLGSECPAQNGACAREQPLPGDPRDGGGTPPEQVRDAGEPPLASDGGGEDPSRFDAASGDAGRDATVGSMRDAYVPEDAGPALFPPFLNPSFEIIDGGTEGELPTTSPGVPNELSTSIPPWYTCRSGTTLNSSWTVADPFNPGAALVVYPTEGKTFVTDTFPIVAFNFNGFSQDLAEPLRPGQRYAFAVDVWAERDALPFSDLVLELAYGDPLGCLLGRNLASSPMVATGGWRKVCLDFVAPAGNPPYQGVRTLMLMINAPRDYANTARMHIDNIRPADCN